MDDQRTDRESGPGLSQRVGVGVGLILLGSCILFCLFAFNGEIHGAVVFGCLVGAGSSIGAGIFNTFGRPVLGAILGAIIPIVLVIYLFSIPHIVG
jgi:hypothetical protein